MDAIRNSPHIRLSDTRFTEVTGVKIAHHKGVGWRHIDTNDERWAEVGPIYRTKDELLADHEAYLIRSGWMRG